MVTLLWWLAANALVVAALVPAVWLLCRLLRCRPGVQHLLWFLLFFKLIAPPVINWPWPADYLNQYLPQERVTNTPTDAPVGLQVESAPYVAAAVVPDEPTELSRSPLPAAAIEERALKVDDIAVFVWSAGAVLLAAGSVVALRRQRRILRGSVQAPAHLLAVIARVAEKLGVRPPRVAVSAQIFQPLVACMGRPRLLWPATMSDPDVVDRSDGIIAHELAHLARRDHYLVYAELVVSVLCWWNPLMWLIRRSLRETRELACDAVAMVVAAQPRPDYARRILSLSVSGRDWLSFAPAFGAGTSSRRFLKRRLTMVFDDRVCGRVTLGGMLLAALVAILALPGLTLGQAAAVAQPESGGSAAIAGGPSTASNATTETEVKTTEDGVTKRNYSRASSLKRLIKNEEISGENSVEIALGSGGILRISKNDQGDLIVTVEQTETIRDYRPRSGVIVGTSDGIAIEDSPETGTATARTVRDRTASGGGSASSFIRSGRRTAVAGSRDDGAVAEFDRRLLASDVELAQVSLLEKRAELEIAQSDKVDASRLKLAELAVRRAEIELERAKLRLSQGSRRVISP
jgi:beta-lactamase regulating signal transducer with metallopeptidase domain